MDLHGIPPEALLAVAGALAVLAVVQSVRLALRRWQLRRRLEAIRERGAWGEDRACGVLRRLGFAIVGREVATGYELMVDGERVWVGLRADYVVADRRGRYVAEVKTGELAPRIETAATRRQLLEYHVAFRRLGVRGVLLIDAETATVRVVEFPLEDAHRRAERGLVWLFAGIAAGTVAVVVNHLF